MMKYFLPEKSTDIEGLGMNPGGIETTLMYDPSIIIIRMCITLACIANCNS